MKEQTAVTFLFWAFVVGVVCVVLFGRQEPPQARIADRGKETARQKFCARSPDARDLVLYMNWQESRSKPGGPSYTWPEYRELFRVRC
jgi:hypothetical protein